MALAFDSTIRYTLLRLEHEFACDDLVYIPVYSSTCPELIGGIEPLGGCTQGYGTPYHLSNINSRTTHRSIRPNASTPR